MTRKTTLFDNGDNSDNIGKRNMRFPGLRQHVVFVVYVVVKIRRQEKQEKQ